MDPSSSRRSFQQWLEGPGVGEILAGTVAALFYVATLAYGFVYDDVPQILHNPAIRGWHFLPQYFTSHVWAAIFPNTAGNYYRPIFLVWLRVNEAIFGTNAWGWHFASILGHMLVACLVFHLALKLSEDRLTALICAVIFAVHPAHVENVAWISGVTDTLATCFLLSSLLLFFTSRQNTLHQLGSLVCFAFAVLSKESAVVLPFLIFVYAINLESSSDSAGSQRLNSAIRLTLPYVAVTFVYGIVRYVALHGWSHATIPLTWRQVLFTLPSVLWFYTRHLFFPFKTSEFYPLDYTSRLTLSDGVLPLIYFIAAISCVCLLVRAIATKDPSSKLALRFSVALMVLPLIPVLDLRSLTPGDIVHDRYLYLPSVGFCLLLALAIRVWFRQKFPLQMATAGIIAGLFAGITVTQQMQWADDIALYTHGAESAPDNLTVRDNLANALLDRQPDKAIPLYLEVLKRKPQFWRSNYNLGVAYYKLAQYQAAGEYLRKAIAIDQHDPDQYIYLALTDTRLQNFQAARQEAQTAIALNTGGQGYHAVLGMIYEALNDRDRALAEFKTELAAHPDNAPAAAELERLEQVTPAAR